MTRSPATRRPVSTIESATAPFRPPGWSWAQAGEVGWWVRPEWRRTLLGPDGLRLVEWQREGRLSRVKAGPHRVVYRADLPEGTVYVKHFLVPSWREVIRQWFRRGKARNEAKRADRLADIGVPTITPIALGEQRKRRFLFENYLVTPAIADSLPLDEFVERRLSELPSHRQARIRQRLSVAVAELTARLHDEGLVHQDFHPGNLLVRLDSDDRPLLSMIDLDALRARRRLNWGDVRANLALLNHYFWLRCERSDRLRFLRAYLAARGMPAPDPAGLARGIETATRSWAERLWRRWGRRCHGSNKYFKSYRSRDGWAIASRDLDRDLVKSLLPDPDEPFLRADAVILKDSRTTTVAELTLPVRGRPTRVIYKRFNRKKRIDPILTLFRPSRAWRAWQAGQHLASRAVPTPKNLAVIARSRRGRRFFPHHYWPHETYLVTVKAEPSATLYDYFHSVLPALDPEARRVQSRRMTLALARLIRTLHERSLSHRDLKVANILVEGDPAVEPIRLSLIDLVGVHLEHPLPHGRRIQNLARLQISLAGAGAWSRTDSLRFLRAYLCWARRDQWKKTWREVERRCHVKEDQNRRRGRLLS